ncbi:RING/U-box superfamily protein [Striga asiatica]|uniref:RING/U-box superfamily protein n=1 Tax=Striga asiatica TaxID=4170 RepID=A0A5A7QB63_STRAF|nr:RING/U-box superfamily protein [Striga asiatica]
MGAACCVAANGKTVTNRSPGENLQRHVHHSPSWSFRWDNRGRVAGEETHSNWAGDEVCGNSRIGAKFGATVEAAFASEEGSPFDGTRSNTWRKSPLSEGNSGTLRLQSSDLLVESLNNNNNIPSIFPTDQAVPQNIPEIKEPTNSPSVAYSPSLKLSPSVPSLSSKSASPSFSTPLRWHQHSRIPKSPSFSISEEPPSSLQAAPSWGNDSNGGSSDSWSIPAARERWSFDSEASGPSRDRFTRFSRPHSSSPSLDFQTCGICTRLLTEGSSFGQKLMYAVNELAVVSVLTCGHVYHSECLEYMTLEIDKYDPTCPVCTFGEKRAVKMMLSEKAMRGETDSKARRKSRKRVVSSDFSGEIVFDRSISGGGGPDGRGLKIGSGSTRKPFLRRHFSFGAKTSSRQSTDRQSSNPRKGAANECSIQSSVRARAVLRLEHVIESISSIDINGKNGVPSGERRPSTHRQLLRENPDNRNSYC